MNFFAKSLSRISTGILEYLENFEKKVRADFERYRYEAHVANISKRELKVEGHIVNSSFVVGLSFEILIYFRKSDLSELEISESWITANLNELLGDRSNSGDYVGIPYIRIYRRFRVMSQLNSWINTKEEVGCMEGACQEGAYNPLLPYKYLVVFPPADSTRFTIKKLK
jgi:hypothetical protein